MGERVEMSAAAYILHRPPTFCIGRRHFGMFSASRAGTTSRASTADTPPLYAERICKQIPLEDRMVESQHLQKEIFSGTEKENRVESLPSPVV